MRPGRVIIVGAGIGGMSLAAALHRLDVPVLVLERAARLGEVGAGLGVLPNAVRALAAIGVSRELYANAG
ncbi:MAG TPA: NAD(P)-binding protein, partial [Candidatus Binatia bacterium]|nr:NAD(P)-binding protein [Candidatus Binatia bacterium]